MSLFKNTYSGLITGGLGLPACCGMITLQFHVFKCTIAVIPGAPIGGSTPVTQGGFYVPFPKKMTQTTKQVLITVKFSRDHVWRKAYVVDNYKADIIVKIFNIINTITNNFNVGVNTIKHKYKQVTAIFTKVDK